MSVPECSLCAADLDHCHGTLLAHTDGALECTEPDCTDGDRIRHLFITDCSDIAGGCHCLVVEEYIRTGPQTLAG
ncbi:hypothetical protein [Nocardia inohanensis]|uniref:hypothetical protein n=1 Tax=Nocardia inohanensis TaxID=209246 RepID=UPI0008312D77|nr:hypothetical protein [Nocardia inohanensis]